MDTQVVILAAGMGTRLGRPFPKPLTPLKDDRTILAHQLANIKETFGSDAQIMIVVGFKLEQILTAAPSATFVYNERYEHTNTSKSLLRALQNTGDRGVLWMNGDVIFHPDVLTRAKQFIDEEKSFVCVDTAVTADEEVKYTVSDTGMIRELSKTLAGGLGEAVGINYISPADKPALTSRLADVADQDYFERGIEVAIVEDKLNVLPIDISDLYAVEIDFDEDLAHANSFF